MKEWCNENKIDSSWQAAYLFQKKISKPQKIEKNAIKNGCKIELIEYDQAIKIQPELVRRKYIYGPLKLLFLILIQLSKYFTNH